MSVIIFFFKNDLQDNQKHKKMFETSKHNINKIVSFLNTIELFLEIKNNKNNDNI